MCISSFLVLVSPGQDAKDWNIEVLTVTHNGDNDAELSRVRENHPGEPECVVDRRVLGALAPTRCKRVYSSFSHFASVHCLGISGFGDIPFKQSPVFTRRILYNLFPGFHNTSPWEEFLVRNITPPYITAEPEINHRRLDNGHSNGTSNNNRPLPRTKTNNISFTKKPFRSINKPTPATNLLPRFLILASDGFADLCEGEGQTRIVESWANDMISRNPPESVTDAKPWSQQDNMALRLLRRTLGGEDRFGVSRVLTLEMDGSWIDDTSIVVQTL